MDHAATSPLHPEALNAMMPYFNESFGNPSSIHRFGRAARSALDQARKELAATIGAHPNELIFTSGGTESDNLAIIGYVTKNYPSGHVITSQIEHHAVLHAFAHLEEKGYEVTYLPADDKGLIRLDDLKQAVREDTVFVSIMLGNNETGAIQPIQEIGRFLREKGIAFHTDAVQAYGMLPIDVNELGVDFLSVSSHKINGPKGVGFLYARNGMKLAPILFGGEQERKRRAGTENVAAIVGMACAAKIAQKDLQHRASQYAMFRKEMVRIFMEENIDFIVNGNEEFCLPHILNISFIGTKVESLLANLDIEGIAVSSGSACTAGSHKVSHVLSAMGCADDRLRSAIRFSFGRGNTLEDVIYVAKKTAKIVQRICQK